VDKKIKTAFEKVKKIAGKQENKLVKEDIQRDKRCEVAEKKARKK